MIFFKRIKSRSVILAATQKKALALALRLAIGLLVVVISFDAEANVVAKKRSKKKQSVTTRLERLLSQERWLNESRFGPRKLRRLSSGESLFARSLMGKSGDRFLKAKATFEETTGQKLSLHWMISELSHSIESKSHQQANLIGFIESPDGKNSWGFFNVKILKKQNQDPEALLDGQYLSLSANRPKNLSKAIRKFLDSGLYKPNNIKKEMLRASYMGRETWPKHGFRFVNNEIKPFLDVDGTPKSSEEMTVANWKRFLTKHEILEESLLVREPLGQTQRWLDTDGKLSLERLLTMHSADKRLAARPMINENVFGESVFSEKEQTMHLGQAFMNGDSNRKPGDHEVIQDVERGPKSAYSMPSTWMVRDIL